MKIIKPRPLRRDFIVGALAPWLNGLSVACAHAQTRPAGVHDTLPMFSPLDFGAKGDGVADDTAACNAAATQAQAANGVLVFPPGLYAISGFIVVRDGVRGVFGRGGTIRCINTQPNAGLLLAGRAHGQPTNVRNCRVEGLHIDCNGQSANVTVAIFGQNVSDCTITGNRIDNLVRGYGILLRSFGQGQTSASDNTVIANEIAADTSGKPQCWGIAVDATLDFTDEAGGAPGEWRKHFRAGAAKHPARNHVIEDNNVTGGYYGLSLSAAHDCVIRRNTLAMNMRNMSLQNGCVNNVVENNDCKDSLSTAIHLAYGSSNNRVVGNRVRTHRARGEGLLQAYVGSANNLFQNNTVEAVSPAAPKYFLYTGVHADGNQFVNNMLSGPCARAYVAVETGFNPKSAEPAHYNHGQGGAGEYSQRGTSGVVIRGNRMSVQSAVPVIYLAQIADHLGSYALTDCVIADNTVQTDPSISSEPPLLKLVEDTPGGIDRLTLQGNRFPAGSRATQFNLPRGADHFVALKDNVGFLLPR
jgi:parallel beta-helix repeat protein